jgi:hypothetical protein
LPLIAVAEFEQNTLDICKSSQLKLNKVENGQSQEIEIKCWQVNNEAVYSF